MKLTSSVQSLLTFRIREYIKYTVKRPLYGLATGIITTIIFQSSSATTVLAVGMVSAGLISFYNSLAVLLGADIGTTLTVQLVVWKFTDVSPLVVIAGGVLWFLAKQKWKNVGEAVFYFGLIFFGLNLMVMAAAPLKQSTSFIDYFSSATNPLIGAAIGIIVSSVIQSSAITISVLAILAQDNLVTIQNALPIIFGANVGTAVTAIIAGAAADTGGRRTAIAHFLFKFGGLIIGLLLISPFASAVRFVSPDVPQQIAFGHFLFNALIVVFFIFVLKPFSLFVEKIIPGVVETLPLWPEFLDEKYLSSPDKALQQVRKELEREIQLARRMLSISLQLFDDYRERVRQNVGYIELVLDRLRDDIVQYLWRISCNELDGNMSRKLFAYTAMVDDIERIGDHAYHIAQLAQVKYNGGIGFSDAGKVEVYNINQMIMANVDDAAALIKNIDVGKVQEITLREDIIDEKVKDAREKHLVRFHERVCQAQAGPIFVELLIHLERISDHCQNIAEYMIDVKS